MKSTVTIVGGCGHVGIPLGLALADAGHTVRLLDINQTAVDLLNRGVLPFQEEGGQEVLERLVGTRLQATTNPEVIRESQVVVFVTGTPVDEHLNPRINDIIKVLKTYLEYLSSETLVVLRSTVYPGVVEVVDALLREALGSALVSFCPERIVQGKGITEIGDLPQLVSGTSERAVEMAIQLFSTIAPKIISLTPREAELAKLITNSWRYLEFAIANQFYMMLEDQGLDFFRVFEALRDEYPRARHFAYPGLAAGPCLFKDTMQLSAFHQNQFFLGQAAMLINEGLPNFLVKQLEQKMGSLNGLKIALLGMTFKANNDDTRESLSFKVKKLLEFKMAKVLISDPYMGETYKLDEALEQADGVILGVPHREYLDLVISKPFVDCWGVWRKRGVQ